jgi:hypothetical protein
MTFKDTFETIKSSEVFNTFINENPNAELCAGFFIIDFFGNDNKKSLDYKVGERIFSFSIDDFEKIKMKEDKLVEETGVKFPKLEKIEPNINIDLDEIKSIAGIKALDEGISSKFSKIIAVLQKHEGKYIWNLTCMLEGLIILHVLIDAMNGDIIKFERKSMMDLIKRK